MPRAGDSAGKKTNTILAALEAVAKKQEADQQQAMHLWSLAERLGQQIDRLRPSTCASLPGPPSTGQFGSLNTVKLGDFLKGPGRPSSTEWPK